MPAHLCLGHTYAQLAAGFEVGGGAVYLYITEAVGLLAARAPDLTTAVTAASAKAFVTLDGTLLPIDRTAADRPYYSGKHKKHGMNVLVIADPHGKLLWASSALPGAVHDIKAARTHGIIDALAEEDQDRPAAWPATELCTVELSRDRRSAAVVARCRHQAAMAWSLALRASIASCVEGTISSPPSVTLFWANST